jgi:hypothetical protein
MTDGGTAGAALKDDSSPAPPLLLLACACAAAVRASKARCARDEMTEEVLELAKEANGDLTDGR